MDFSFELYQNTVLTPKKGKKWCSLSAEYGTKITSSESRHARDSGAIYGEMSTLAYVDAVTLQNELLIFPWIDFNAV